MTTDTVADLMNLADEYAVADENATAFPERAALESAIRAALAEARRDALEEAAQLLDAWVQDEIRALIARRRLREARTSPQRSRHRVDQATKAATQEESD